MQFLPTYGQVPLPGYAHDEEDDPGHDDALSWVPEVREDVDVDGEADSPHLNAGVVHDGGNHVHAVKNCQATKEVVKARQHFSLPAKICIVLQYIYIYIVVQPRA